MHLVLVDRLGGLSLPRNRLIRLTDLLVMTIAVYRGRKAIKTATIVLQYLGWKRYFENLYKRNNRD